LVVSGRRAALGAIQRTLTKDGGGFSWGMGLILASSLLVYAVMRLLRITR
jgi:hypothetical protein